MAVCVYAIQREAYGQAAVSVQKLSQQKADIQTMNQDRMQAMQAIRQHAQGLRQKGDIAGLFQLFYEKANGDASMIPWAQLAPRPLFAEWANANDLKGEGKQALQVASGLGDDAEELARRGFEVTAFDIAPTAIEWSRRRFPQSRVHYQVADLFALPQEWQHKFDFILESYTLQAMPLDMRARAIECIARCAAPGSSILIITLGRDPEEPIDDLPMPMTREDLAAFERYGLRQVSFEDIRNPDNQAMHHFRVLYRA
jgi:2-polyprenyl-3-methyl-5-hydroxy-6-metoxy-1,4-benzoquinol methylase